MKFALWILVGLVGIGVALYAGELYRQSVERRVATLAVEKSMKETRAAAEKAALLAEWQRKTEGSIKLAEHIVRTRCYEKDSRTKTDEDVCQYYRAVHSECVDVLNDKLKNGIIPKEECDISVSEPGHALEGYLTGRIQ